VTTLNYQFGATRVPTCVAARDAWRCWFATWHFGYNSTRKATGIKWFPRGPSGRVLIGREPDGSKLIHIVEGVFIPAVLPAHSNVSHQLWSIEHPFDRFSRAHACANKQARSCTAAHRASLRDRWQWHPAVSILLF